MFLEDQGCEGQSPGPEGEDVVLDDLPAQLEEALREKEQFRALAQRAQADLANYKRRVDEEREELHQRLKSQMVLRLLDVADDFERALSHAPAEDAQESWLEGVALISQKLWATLEAEGVSRIDALHQPFDPWEHEALYHEETDSVPEGQVAQVFRQGYRLREKVIRPAQVVVAKRAGSAGGGQD